MRASDDTSPFVAPSSVRRIPKVAAAAVAGASPMPPRTPSSALLRSAMHMTPKRRAPAAVGSPTSVRATPMRVNGGPVTKKRRVVVEEQPAVVVEDDNDGVPPVWVMSRVGEDTGMTMVRISPPGDAPSVRGVRAVADFRCSIEFLGVMGG
ncbi:hypothetical protein AMAG_09578 [Allomyces macrogynus ATCC 38327]|uniref:Uncharacterized protein n=1 Tax=Allomyces macrogynus (strain ATCC 38327) TaxID=578462 RepID=A0A0L0SSR0_ALLM3|nr:hypothetical protein AMAG_09578 [Allomyces macrogynus ATCC 38327]|eukprot:KNE65598.1 hypothetical protein AMAG_09578 [Allomyces macrogynus ATCC 38327]